jgi:hypothetical protein
MAVMAEIGSIEKKQQNTTQNFMFRGIGDAMSACQPLFVKHGMYLRPLTVRVDNTKENLDKDGKPRGTHSRQIIVYRATCAEDASYIDSEVTGEAIDFADKCAGKVASISFKTLIFQMFCIPDHNPENDPDGQSPGVAPSNGEGDKKTAAAKTARKALVATLAKLGKEKPAEVLEWMTAQLKKDVRATKDLTEAEIAQLTESANAILKETT